MKKKRNSYVIWVVLILCLIIAGIKGCISQKTIEQPYIKLYLHQENRVIKLKLEDYIIGTVAAEMPASFELEALKAQAVCARTYALRKLVEGRKYPLDADLSDDINSCQAYISPAEFKNRNPRYYKPLLDKIEQACHSTRGLIMVYNDQPIDALYHSTCGGKTETAAEAWGLEVPYLHSVKCGYCTASKYYKTSLAVSADQLQTLTAHNIGTLTLRVVERSSSGRVKKLEINQQPISAEKFRRSLNLPSTWWEFNNEKDKLIITSHGYGHGVGLCQFGANGMAKEGNNYREILNKYYQHIDFCTLKWKDEK